MIVGLMKQLKLLSNRPDCVQIYGGIRFQSSRIRKLIIKQVSYLLILLAKAFVYVETAF